MVITVTKLFQFNLYQYIPVSGTIGGVVNTIVLASCSVVPGSQQTVPDWVANDDLFTEAVNGGEATVITAPTGATELTAGLASSNVELALPATGSTVYITNQSANAYIWVALGTSDAVAVTPQTGTPIYPGSTVKLALGSNSYLAAISAESSTLVNICVL